MADPRGDRATPPSPPAFDVPVAPVGPAGGGRRLAPVVGVVMLVVVLGGGIALAQSFPATPVTPSVRPPPVAEASASVAPSRTPGLALPARLGATDLVARVLDGSIDEWIVYADARLRSGCQPPGARGCTVGGLAIEGLALEVVPRPEAPADAVVPPGAVLVLRVRGHRLEYLGSLLTHPVAPSIAILGEELTSVSPVVVQPTFHDAGGWLIPHPPCFHAASPEPPCAVEPFLAQDQPLPDGTLRTDDGATVALAPDIWGVDPQRDTVAPGPFLVRHLATGAGSASAGPRWEVAARYEPTKSVRIVIP